MPERIPTPAEIKRWRQYLADERAEASVYRDLAKRRDGEEHDILMALATAEGRHEQHWLDLLGDHAGPPMRPSSRNRLLGLLARRFGSVFVLALAQRSESSPHMPPMLMPPMPWPRMNQSTRKWFAGSRQGAATGSPDPLGQPSLAPTTASSATFPS